jgi:phosphorylcholine metabolism protein LicD
MLLNNGSKYKIFNVEHTINENLIIDKPIPMTDINILENLYNVIRYTTQFLQKNNIIYCIESGTLLGCVRHQGIIPWDNDMDITIFKDGYDKMLEIQDQFNRDGFRILHCTPGFKIFFNQVNYGELFVYDFNSKLNGYCMAYPYLDDTPTFYTHDLYFNTLYKKNDIFPLQQMLFEDFIVYVPNNIVNILKTLYSGNLLKCKYIDNKNDSYTRVNINHYSFLAKCEYYLTKNKLFLCIYYMMHLFFSTQLVYCS